MGLGPPVATAWGRLGSPVATAWGWLGSPVVTAWGWLGSPVATARPAREPAPVARALCAQVRVSVR
jgi:hypothetical protein